MKCLKEYVSSRIKNSIINETIFLNIILQLCDIISIIHKNNIIFKYLNPYSIFIKSIDKKTGIPDIAIKFYSEEYLKKKLGH